MKYTLKTETIVFSGGEITVRGLTVPDIVQLVGVHRDTAASIYSRFTGANADNLSQQTVEGVAVELIGSFPAAIAHLLYLCDTDQSEENTVEDYARLPVDVQVTALEKITTLTFAMQGGPKNFVETVTRIVASAGGLSNELRKPQTLTNGSGDSGRS